MAIEWNKVTWYSKFLAIIIFVCTFALAFYQGMLYERAREQMNMQPIVAPVPQKIVLDPVNLKVGDTRTIGRDLSMKLVKVLEDSRCPADVQCIWAGRVRIEVELSTDGITETKELVTDTEPTVFGKYRIEITSIKPETKAGIQIADKDYVIGFHVVLMATAQ